MKAHIREQLKSLPSVTELLDQPEVCKWLENTPRRVVVDGLRSALDETRELILAGEEEVEVSVEQIVEDASAIIDEQSAPSLRRVINATGVVLHTGLGRAPLCEAAIDAIADGAAGYCNLEFDLESGKRGRRIDHVEDRLCRLTHAEAAVVVNNNAAATLLILQTFASGREALVSRGQLIEIGGSFRLPDIMRAGGVTLREVGTTNRTRLSDYANAVCEHTALIIRAHSSNYRIVGFTEEVPVEELVSLAQHHNLLVVDDIGSGAMVDPAEMGLGDEPNVIDSVASGADLVCFSGDKLMGGPQCGIILGREELIRQLETNPLTRTYRPDKLVLLALEATLAQYEDEEHALETVPTLAMLSMTTEELASRAQDLSTQLSDALPDEDFLVCSGVGYAGGGSLPQEALQTVLVQWRPSTGSASHFASLLRSAPVPVIVPVRDEALCFDLRTIAETDFEALVRAITWSLAE
ncbi:MAG: L-seryl-tRNA(Sec) selenium transferase [Planctomycetota bacterium]|jgi:L-seryl-tRNA(Ser) seleniumtransferase